MDPFEDHEDHEHVQVEVSQPELVSDEGLMMDNAHRKNSKVLEEGELDIEELIRKLEAYRLQLKLDQVRERSKALQNNGTANLSYKPRYSVMAHDSSTQTPETGFASRRLSRMSMAGIGGRSGDAALADKKASRRTTRLFQTEPKLSREPSVLGGQRGRKSVIPGNFYDDGNSDAELPAVPARNARRTTRIFGSSKLDPSPPPITRANTNVSTASAGDKSDDKVTSNVPETSKKSKRRSIYSYHPDTDPSGSSGQAFVNPKLYLAARNDGMNEAQAIKHLQSNAERDEAEESARIRADWHKKSFAFLEGPAGDGSPDNRSRSGTMNGGAMSTSEKRRSRIVSGNFDNLRYGVQQHWSTANGDTVPEGPATSRAEKRRSKAWLPPVNDRPDWAQDDDVEKPSMLEKMAKRSSRIFAASSRPGTAGHDNATLSAAPTLSDKRSSRFLGPPSRESADSAIDVSPRPNQTSATKGATAKKPRLGFRKSIANLFRSSKS